MRKFKVGQKLSARSLCDHNCIFTGEVLKRTAKTVTIRNPHNEVKRCKIHTSMDGNEMIFPLGNYSMAPIFEA